MCLGLDAPCLMELPFVFSFGIYVNIEFLGRFELGIWIKIVILIQSKLCYLKVSFLP